MNIDFSNVPDIEGLPVGKYPVKVINYEPVTNNRTGNEGIQFLVKNEQGQSGKYTIWTTKNNGSEPNHIGIKKFAVACGIPKDEKRFQPSMLAGKKFIATVEVNQDKPEFTNVVRADPFIEGSKPAAPSAPMSVAQQTAAIAPAERQPGEDDDLPF